MSKIEWTQETWNPITGCTKYSAGCKNCYACTMTKRLQAMGQEKYAAGFSKVVFHDSEFYKDFGKKPKMIFVNSMSDTFHKDVTSLMIERIFCKIEHSEQHTFQILTKRSERLKDIGYSFGELPKNVWLGVTVEHADYKFRIDDLRKTNAKIKFLSCEPLLGDLGELDLTGIDWVICGGESGANARPMHPDWVRNIQRQCKEQNVPFFFKQWGEWCAGSQIDYDIAVKNFNTAEIGDSNIILNVAIDKETGSYKVGKKIAGCLLDGKTYKEYPSLHENPELLGVGE